MLASAARRQADTREAMRMAALMASEFEEKAAKARGGVRTAAPMMTSMPPPSMVRPPPSMGMAPPMAMPMPMMHMPPMHMPVISSPHPEFLAREAERSGPTEEKRAAEEISTNSIEEMKTDKEVLDELSALKPTAAEKSAIDGVLAQTADDSSMQQSKFFELLRSLSDKPQAADGSGVVEEFKEEDLATRWREQFASWDPMKDVDWAEYLKTTDPSAAGGVIETASKDPEYEFAAAEEMIGDSEASADADERDYFAEGLRLMKEGNLNEAIAAFEAVVRKSPMRSEAWRYLGICHADNESEKQGIAAFLKCHELDPFDLDALLQLGVSYTNEIEQIRALNYLKQWVSNHPDYGLLAEALALESAELDLGGWTGLRAEQQKVIKLFTDALALNDTDADLHIVLGVLFNLTSEYSKGELHFKKAIQIRPDDASLWNKLGATQANGGHCEEAIVAYSRALELKPNYVRALSNLGISFANQDLHVKACQSYLASLKRNPHAAAVWDHLSMSLIHLGRGDLCDLAEKRDVTVFAKHFDF